MKTSFQHGGMVSAALVASISVGAISHDGGAKVPLATAATASHAAGPAEMDLPLTCLGSTPPALPIGDRPREWTKALERRFGRLAEREALGAITGEERHELARLASHRRYFKAQSSPEEIIHRIRQQRATEGLLAALQTYVRFHESAGPARRAASDEH